MKNKPRPTSYLRHLLPLITMLLLLSVTFPVSAHGYIVRAIPENRAVLDRAPTRLQYWFSESLEPDFSQLNVRDQNGDIIAVGGVSETDSALMTVRLPDNMPDGAYVVELRPAFASDGHVVAESRVFFIGAEIGGVAGRAAQNQAVPLEVVWRVIVLTSCLMLFGAFTLYSGILIPAWGNPTYPAGWLPPRVMKRLNVIVGYALLFAFIGNGLALIQQTMVFFNIGFTQALNFDFWSLVRIGSRFGDVWNWRMMFLGLIGIMYLAGLYSTHNHPEFVRPFWIANTWISALIIGSFSVLSHAAGSLLWPWVGITVDWLHALAVGFWASGIVVLVLVMPVALAPYQAEARRTALLAVLRRFSRYAALALFLVIATGIYSASIWFHTPADVTSTFGAALAIKLALAAMLIAVGALHHFALNPVRYARWQRFTISVKNFTGTLRLEAVLVFAVLIGVAYLSATPVPTPEFAGKDIETPTAVQQAGDLTVVMSILPGGPGVNTYDTTITRAGSRVEGLKIQLRQVRPADDKRGDWHITEAGEPGLYIAAGDDIDAEGLWWTLMDITTPNGTQSRVAFDWAISNEAAVLQSLDPTIGNLAAFALVLLAVGLTLYPGAKRLMTILNLDAASVTIAAGAIIATMIAIAFGFVVIQQSRQNYADTLNPPPEVVNTVLPTQASLDRGQRLLLESCPAWQETRDFNALIDRLPRTRDEEIFVAVRDGWRGLPACSVELSFFQRWDVVNYIRTFETIGL